MYSAGEDIQDNGLLGIGNAMLSVPTGLISGRYESPSQAIGRFALRNDANQLRNAMIDDQGNPTGLGMATDIFGPMALGHVLPKGADLAVKTLGTEEGLLSNAYKINPSALKENPEMFLYRARPVGQNVDMNMAAQMRAKQAAGEPLTWYQKNLLNPQTNPQLLAREKYYGQWFEKDPSRLDFYIQSGTRNFADDDVIEILRTRLPKKEAAKFNVSQFNDAKVLSASPETEFILPKDMITSAERFPESSWQQLIKEDKAFNKPHWWKGFKKEGGGKNKPNIKETPAQADALNDAKTFQEQWMESPMYNQMITNSVAKDNPYGLDSSYVDYITMKRKQGLDATTASATDWSGDHRNVVPGKSDYYYKNQLRGVNYKDTDKQRLDSFPSPLGYIFNDPNTAYRNEGYNFVPELGYFNTLVNHNLHNHHFRDTSGHEISHATDWNGWFIPESDKIKMAKYKNVYAKNPAEGDYIGTPTETRARLNSIRQLSKDAGYYDPFTQRATMDVLNKFKTLDNNQYKQLKQIYTDAEILDMLNTISMSDNNQYQNYG